MGQTATESPVHLVSLGQSNSATVENWDNCLEEERGQADCWCWQRCNGSAVVFATAHPCLLELSMNLREVFAVLGEGPYHVKALVMCNQQSTIWKFREPPLTALLSTAHLALRHDVGEHLGQLRQRVARPRHGSRLHHPHLHRGIRIESLCLVTEMSLLFVCRLVSYLHIRHQTASGAVLVLIWIRTKFARAPGCHLISHL